MTPDTVITVGRQALEAVILLAAPMLLSVLAVGLLVSMFQAATQINEMTLSFIPKLVVLFLALILFGPWMLRILMGFTSQIIENIPTMLG